MDLGYGLTETVQFELPDLAGAARLATLLRSRWAVSVNEEDDVALVDVYVRPRTDLASLMRTVEDWVARESLRSRGMACTRLLTAGCYLRRACYA